MAVAAPVAITPPTPPEQPPQPTPLPVAPQGCEAVNGYDWNKRIAYAVCMAESGGVAGSHVYSDETQDDSYGLFQINLYGNLKYDRPAPAVLLTAQGNVEYAYRLYVAHNGFTPWSAYKSGKYLTHMN